MVLVVVVVLRLLYQATVRHYFWTLFEFFCVTAFIYTVKEQRPNASQIGWTNAQVPESQEVTTGHEVMSVTYGPHNPYIEELVKEAFPSELFHFLPLPPSRSKMRFGPVPSCIIFRMTGSFQ